METSDYGALADQHLALTLCRTLRRDSGFHLTLNETVSIATLYSTHHRLDEASSQALSSQCAQILMALPEFPWFAQFLGQGPTYVLYVGWALAQDHYKYHGNSGRAILMHARDAHSFKMRLVLQRVTREVFADVNALFRPAPQPQALSARSMFFKKQDQKRQREREGSEDESQGRYDDAPSLHSDTVGNHVSSLSP